MKDILAVLHGAVLETMCLGVSISPLWAAFSKYCIKMGSKDQKCHTANELFTLHLSVLCKCPPEHRLIAEIWDQWAAGSRWKW